MAKPEDVRARKKIRSIFIKRMVDITGMNLQVMHGVAYIRGVIKPIKGGAPDLQVELDLITKLIRQDGVVKDVVVDCAIRS